MHKRPPKFTKHLHTSKLSCFLVAQLVKEGVEVDCSLSLWLVLFFMGESGLIASSLMLCVDDCFIIGMDIRCDSKLEKMQPQQFQQHGRCGGLMQMFS